MSKIYLVTSGEYSDFGVVAAYSKQEDAEKAVADGLGDAWEECPLDAPREKMPDGMKFYSVTIRLADGHCWPAVRESYDGDGTDKPFTLRKARSFADYSDEWFTVECWAKDDEHACKIASEKRREHLAALSIPALIKLAEWKPPEPPAGITIAITRDDIIRDGMQPS